MDKIGFIKNFWPKFISKLKTDKQTLDMHELLRIFGFCGILP